MRRLEREIKEVEAGTRERLGEEWPSRARGGHRAISMRCSMASARVSGVIATRWAISRTVSRRRSPSCASRWVGVGNAGKAALDSEIDRMSGIIEHQMKRAATSGGVLLGQAPVDVAPRGCRAARRVAQGLRRQGHVARNGDRAGRAVHRRSRRSHRAARQSARQRLQVVPFAGAHRSRDRAG